jgi:hypothetical protein
MIFASGAVLIFFPKIIAPALPPQIFHPFSRN